MKIVKEDTFGSDKMVRVVVQMKRQELPHFKNYIMRMGG